MRAATLAPEARDPVTERSRSVQISAATPIRCCLVTRTRCDRAALIRFVVGPDGVVVPDLKGALPGRGMWLSATRETIKMACARNVFSRASRRAVRVPDDLDDQVEALLAARCCAWVTRAWRSGDVCFGYEKVRAALRGGGLGALVEARDGSMRQRLSGHATDLPLVDVLTLAEIGSALNRLQVAHVRVAKGGIADALLADARRLAGFRTGALARRVCGE